MSLEEILSGIDETLKKIDGLLEGFYQWFAGQYDPETGGFYYAPSSIGPPEFQPDIESTAQAVYILSSSGLVDVIPPEVKQKLIRFIQSRQDPRTGYFYDPHNKMREVYRMVGRAVIYSKNCLAALGSKPLYPLPGERGIDNLPEQFQNPEQYRTWLENLNWRDPWMAGDAIQVSGNYLVQLSESERRPFLEQVLDFLREKQDGSTGFWGEGDPFRLLSGAFKIALFYNRVDESIPNPERIYQSIFNCIRTEIPTDMCFVRNPVDLLSSLAPHLTDIPKDDLLEFLRITSKNLALFKRPDGGFSRGIDKSPAAPNEVVLGRGLCEGDMNAGTQALRIRNYCYNLAGRKAAPLVEYIGDFYKNWR